MINSHRLFIRESYH